MRINHGKKPVRTLCFEDAAAFNHALDTDKALQNGMQKLAEQIPHITEADYIAGILRLFRNAGLKLSAQEFRTLLLLRKKTDQMLLEEAKEKGTAVSIEENRTDDAPK